ncbi:MAG: YkgJ family cysteine cluster protein [Lachnospiraceae bacterium]|nr:YkgJ family cysteine cluster protein [Lachnospiraceae bacterium]
MLYTIPDYYYEFSCIAGDCPDTCCAGWQIVIDEKSQKKYKKYPGDFGKRLKSSVDWREGVFRQKNKRCAFLNDENLCDIYKNAGPAMLCDTCRKYPRHVEEYEDLREISLSLSCPVVAQMLMNRREPVRFLTKERKIAPEEYEEFDYMLFTKLCDARDVMISILQDRTEDIRTRMAMVIALGHDLQLRVSRGQLFEVDTLLGRYGAEGAVARFEKRCKPYIGASREESDELWCALYALFDELEVLKSDFPAYRRERLGYIELFGSISDAEAICLEQLMVYFIYTYFCGAVYDEQAYGKVKFAVVSTFLIRRLYLGDVRCRQGIDKAAMIEAAYRYAKEVEHSDPNLLRMEELLMQRSEFALENLMRVILCRG